MPDRSPRPPVRSHVVPRPHARTVARPDVRRRFLAGMAVALVALLGATGCTPTVSPDAYRRVVHELSLPAFARWWQAEHQVAASTWDLSTDGCSFSPDTGPTFDFRWPCTRHDLAWRNVRRLSSHPSAAVQQRLRREANLRFLADMQARCALEPSWARPSCRAIAGLYHRTVEAVT